MVGQLKEAVSKALAPLSAWETIAEPEVYIESRVGRYISGLEMLLEQALANNDMDASRALTLDLIKMSRLGRSKIDLTSTSVNKLRDEMDFRKVDTSKLTEILGRKVEE
jgi:hypothetical protein